MDQLTGDSTALSPTFSLPHDQPDDRPAEAPANCRHSTTRPQRKVRLEDHSADVHVVWIGPGKWRKLSSIRSSSRFNWFLSIFPRSVHHLCPLRDPTR